MSFNLKAILFLIFLWGCNKDTPEDSVIGEFKNSIFYNIEIDKNNFTKGIPIYNETDTAFKDFAIYAYHSDGIFDITDSNNTLFFDKEEITKNGNIWQTEKTYFWPQNGYLSFFAFAPFSSSCITVNNIPDSYPEIIYTVSQDVTEQPDLMIAVNTENIQRDTVDINFKHALSCIAFNVTGPNVYIDSIGILGVSTSGTVSLNLPSATDTPIWSNLSDINENIFKIGLVPEAIASPDGEQIMSYNGYLMMIPQILTDKAYIIIKFKDLPEKKIQLINKVNTQWEAGKKYIYSLKEGTYDFDIDVKDTICVYSGGSYDFNINSYYNAENGIKTPIKWSAEIISNVGGTDWFNLDSILTLESGGADLIKSIQCSPGTFTTDNLDDIVLQANSEISYIDINDLSYIVSEGYYSTANCYVANSSGWYKFPCFVMGNGIYQNQDLAINNDDCFPDNQTFVNYSGSVINEISDLNINTSGATADLVWEDVPGLINQISISDDNNYIEFYISPEALRQGNAVIAIKNSAGNIMWSWHIWVTNLNPNINLQPVEYDIIGDVSIYKHYLMNKNIGFCSEAEYQYEERSVTVKFTQDISGKTKTIKFIQSGETLNFGNNSLYYQWGRKDPMPGSQGTSSTSEKSCFGPNIFQPSKNTNTVNIQTTISNPYIFYCSNENNNNWMSTINEQLWGVSETLDLKYKSIYDPSPIGFQIFTEYTSKGLIGHASKWESTPGLGYQFSGNDTDAFLYAMGYRSYETGEIDVYGIYGYYWSTEYQNTFIDIIFSQSVTPAKQGSGSAFGYSVCPKQE